MGRLGWLIVLGCHGVPAVENVPHRRAVAVKQCEECPHEAQPGEAVVGCETQVQLPASDDRAHGNGYFAAAVCFLGAAR